MSDNEWRAIEPGVMELPGTKFTICYERGSAVPFRVLWDGVPIPDYAHTHLGAAQAAAIAWVDQLMAIGFEP